MEDRELYKSFLFRLYQRADGAYTDNSAGVNRHYIGYMYRGTAEIVGKNCRLSLQEGDLFYIPKGLKYRSYWYGKEGVVFDSFAFSALPQAERAEYMLQKLPMSEETVQLHRLLAADRTVHARSVGLLYQLLGSVLDTMEQVRYSKGNQLARQLAESIQNEPDLSGQQIARSCGVSESTMYHVLKRELDTTPNRLRQEAKCQQAVRLLTTTDLSVEQISRQLGFSSASYMRKLLNATTGKTPLKLRKEAQNM